MTRVYCACTGSHWQKVRITLGAVTDAPDSDRAVESQRRYSLAAPPRGNPDCLGSRVHAVYKDGVQDHLSGKEKPEAGCGNRDAAKSRPIELTKEKGRGNRSFPSTLRQKQIVAFLEVDWLLV